VFFASASITVPFDLVDRPPWVDGRYTFFYTVSFPYLVSEGRPLFLSLMECDHLQLFVEEIAFPPGLTPPPEHCLLRMGVSLPLFVAFPFGQDDENQDDVFGLPSIPRWLFTFTSVAQPVPLLLPRSFL